MTALHSEPLATDEAELFAKIVLKVYQDFFDVFSQDEAKNMPPHRDFDHKIHLENNQTPPHSHIYLLTGTELGLLREFLDNMLGKGFIQLSWSPAGAPVLFMKKKDGTLQLCVDFRNLNKLTRKDRYLILLVTNLLYQLGSAKVYTKLDLRAGYYNVCVATGHEWKTAFRTHYGSFEFLVMPMGLSNPPATFQAFMNHIFRDMTDIFIVIYLNDILIFSNSLEDHRIHIQHVLECLCEYDLHSKPEKCLFHTQKIEFLGFMVTPTGISMDSAETDTVSAWPTPTNLKAVQAFLGFANFYRRFIVGFSDIVIPLIRLTRKDTHFSWGPDQTKAFGALKHAFTTAPILAHFNPDNPIVVETDASDYAIAAIISQISPEDGDIHPIVFYSRSMQPAELNYEIYDKELLAIFEAFRQWRNYLEGSAHVVLVLSDHKNLEYFATTKQLTRHQVRWS